MNDLKREGKELLNRAKEKIDPIAQDVKEKAAPAIAKAKEAAAGAVEAVKEGAEKIGDLFEDKKPALHVKNELFDDLEQHAQEAKDAAKAKAEEMQRRLEAMMRGGNGGSGE